MQLPAQRVELCLLILDHLMHLGALGVAAVGLPTGWWLATQSGLGATGMWIANLGYAAVNCALTIGWLWTGRWARVHANASDASRTDPSPASRDPR